MWLAPPLEIHGELAVGRSSMEIVPPVGDVMLVSTGSLGVARKAAAR